MRTFVSGILCLGLVIPLAAFAGSAKEQNPVVNLSRITDPGLWQTTTVGTLNGQVQKPDIETECITAADLSDFLDQKDMADMKVEEYSLKGNHFHLKASSKSSPMEVEQDMYFDARDQMHGTVRMTTAGKNAGTITMQIKSHRVSATCPKGGDNH